MADFDTAARQEAERRYPVDPEGDGWGFVAHDREVFAAGARWGVEQADAEVRRLTAALAEANDEAQQFDADRFVERARAERAEAALAEAHEARDIAQGQWRWYQARADRAEALLAEVAALAGDMSDELDMLRAEPGPVALSYANCTAMDLRRIRAILARTEQTGADR